MEYLSNGVKDTYMLAEKIAAKLRGGETIVLEGGLGAGKTTFTKGLAAALGVKREVVSPTFTLVREYEGTKLKLNHFDMYRVEAEELEELGLEEYFTPDAVTVIEWNKPEVDIPGKTIRVEIEPAGENTRIFRINTEER